MLIKELNTKRLFEAPGDSLPDYEIEMAKIPQGFIFDLETALGDYKEGDAFRWQKNIKGKNTWAQKISDPKTGKAKSWKDIPLEPVDPSQPFDRKTNPNTIYTDLWTELVDRAVRDIEANVDKTSSADDPTVTKPIADKQKQKVGDQEFIYSLEKNQWFGTKTGSSVHRGSEMHSLLMNTQGFDVDGTTPLTDSGWGLLMKKLNKIIGGPLGQASKDKAKSWLGRRGGELGDLLGRGWAQAYVNSQMDRLEKDYPTIPEPNKQPNPGDETELDTVGDEDKEEILQLPAPVPANVNKLFITSKRKNPDIMKGARVKHPVTKETWKWLGGQWQSLKSGRLHTVSNKIIKDIIDHVGEQQLQQVLKGERLSILGQPVTDTQQLHAELYAVYHSVIPKRNVDPQAMNKIKSITVPDEDGNEVQVRQIKTNEIKPGSFVYHIGGKASGKEGDLILGTMQDKEVGDGYVSVVSGFSPAQGYAIPFSKLYLPVDGKVPSNYKPRQKNKGGQGRRNTQVDPGVASGQKPSPNTK